jgi:hypothetical protein
MHKQLGNESPANVSKNRLAWLISAKLLLHITPVPIEKRMKGATTLAIAPNVGRFQKIQCMLSMFKPSLIQALLKKCLKEGQHQWVASACAKLQGFLPWCR